MKTVCVHFAEGFEEIEAITVVDILRRGGLNVIMVSITDGKQVTGAHGIKIMADKLFEDIDYNKVDMLILPGGMPGTKNLDEHEGLREQLKLFAGNNKKIAAICAAPSILGNIGILKGKRAICYPGFEKYLSGAKVLDEKVVKEGEIITGKGPGAVAEFAFKILKEYCPEEKIKTLKRNMIY